MGAASRCPAPEMGQSWVKIRPIPPHVSYYTSNHIRSNLTDPTSGWQVAIDIESEFYKYLVNKCSAISTASRAAPRRKLSLAVQKIKPFSTLGSYRNRLTNT